MKIYSVFDPEFARYGQIVKGLEESVAEILERGDRKAAGPTVPPGGLYMTQLWYDDGEVSFHVG